MSFWHTFIGKALHHTLGVGPGSHGTGGGNGPATDQVPLQCSTDIEYYAKHIQQCLPGGPSIGINPGDPILTPSPTSSVPEPSMLALVLCGVVIATTVKYCLKKK